MNIYSTWKQVEDDYGLIVEENIASATLGITMKSEIKAVWMSFNHSGTSASGDATVNGLLRKLKSKRFKVPLPLLPGGQHYEHHEHYVPTG